jgi:uncharacterized protein YbaR (Trm112 family)
MNWIDDERRKILASPVDAAELTQALLTSREEKRKFYACKDKYVTLDTIPAILEPKINTESSHVLNKVHHVFSP